jgi:HrpA-like RNA helicase
MLPLELENAQLSVIRAKTGSGKSTHLTWEIHCKYGSTLSIQPRLQNATGISAWMNFTNRPSGCVTGTTKTTTDQLDYCTTGCAVSLITYGLYNVIVFDEIQDATPEVLMLLMQAISAGKKVIIMSATIPSWCKKLGVKIIDLDTPQSNFKVLSKFGISFEEVLDGSPKVRHNQTLENSLLIGNVLIFINGMSDYNELEENFGYDINSILEQTNSHKLIVFRGTEDSAELIRQVRDGSLPSKGVLIITNVSLGTGVTIPNLRLIWDKAVVIRNKSIFHVTDYKSEKWLDCITKAEAYQRSSRGGRTCDTFYFCGVEQIKLRKDPEFLFEDKEHEICEIVSYMSYCNRVEYFEFLRNYGLISAQNNLESRLEATLQFRQITRVFDGFNVFSNMKAPRQTLEWLYSRMLNEMVTESKHTYTKHQIDQLVKGNPELIALMRPDLCPVQNRILMLTRQASQIMVENSIAEHLQQLSLA